MRIFSMVLFLGITLLIMPSSCKHDPFLSDDDFMPVDTMETNPVDTTTTVDTSDVITPCDPELIYFEKDILPILQSNCAFSGCHDALSAEDGVILDSYENVMATADVEVFNLNDSEIFEVLIDTREDERMPPAPTARLDGAQIQLIGKWILQGAENLECDPDAEGCNTTAVSFTDFVQPTLKTHCQGCHSGPVPSGGVDLTNYDNIKSHAGSGRLYGAINWENGFSPMPRNLDQLSDCFLEKIKAWIDDGAPNN